MLKKDNSLKELFGLLRNLGGFLCFWGWYRIHLVSMT